MEQKGELIPDHRRATLSDMQLYIQPSKTLREARAAYLQDKGEHPQPDNVERLRRALQAELLDPGEHYEPREREHFLDGYVSDLETERQWRREKAMRRQRLANVLPFPQ